MYHYKESRVKGHIFICVLAYTITRIMEIKTNDTIHNIIEKYKPTTSLKINNINHVIGEKTLLEQVK